MLARFVLVSSLFACVPLPSPGQEDTPVVSNLVALPPLESAGVTVFPLSALRKKPDVHHFLTLEEGLRSGDVLFTGPSGVPIIPLATPPTFPDAYTNCRPGETTRVFVINGSSEPLMLLAREAVPGLVRDRLILKDQIIPPRSTRTPVEVLCVVPRHMLLPIGSGATRRAVIRVSRPADRFGAELRRLGAVGVVVAHEGIILGADAFSSQELFQKYLPELLRIYGAAREERSVRVTPPVYHAVQQAEAQRFLEDIGAHVKTETVAGAFSRDNRSGPDFRAFLLRSLVPGLRCEVHFAKLRTGL